MTPEPMGRFSAPALEDLPDDVRHHIEAETERSGFTPNYLAAMAYKPGQYRAFFDYYETIVHDSPLEREEIEILTVTVSGANNCPYCVVAHGALLRIYGEDPYLAEQLMMNHRTADISETHKAMCDLAVKLTHRPSEITEADIERLEDHGFSKEEIWDVGAVTALFNLSNRMVHLADIRPNEEFFDLGRNVRGEVVEDLKDPYLAVDADGCLIDFNPASQRLVPDLDEGAIGEQLADVFPELTEQVEDFQETETLETEISLVRDGEQRHYDLSVAPRTRGPANDQLGEMIVLRDVTLLKERESQLNLMLQVQSRILRHNIRNDLTLIKGTNEVLADELDEAYAEMAKQAVSAAENLMSTTEKAHNAEKLIKQDQEPQPIDLSSLVRDILETYAKEFEDTSFTLDCPEECAIRTIPSIAMACENLIENAAEHNDAETPEVHVRIRDEADATVFQITDNGPGIPNQELSVLKRGEETPLEHGSGIGLWLVDWVIDNSAAEITFDTGLDGTDISIRIPKDETTVPSV